MPPEKMAFAFVQDRNLNQLFCEHVAHGVGYIDNITEDLICLINKEHNVVVRE